MKIGDTLRIKNTPNVRNFNKDAIGEEFLFDRMDINLESFLSGKDSTILDKENKYCINYMLGDVEVVIKEVITKEVSYEIY